MRLARQTKQKTKQKNVGQKNYEGDWKVFIFLPDIFLFDSLPQAKEIC